MSVSAPRRETPRQSYVEPELVGDGEVERFVPAYTTYSYYVLLSGSVNTQQKVGTTPVLRVQATS